MLIKKIRLDKALSWILICTLLVSGCGMKKSQPEIVVLPKENRPNIVFVLVDDLDLKLNSIDYMKNLQELMVAQGTTLDDFLVSTPVCCPSRSTILRGQYTHNHQVYNNTEPNGSFVKFKETGNGDSTLGVWLQAAGYRTALMGKFLNGYPYSDDRLYIPPGWSEWVSPAKKTPYGGYDYVLNENGSLVAYSPEKVNYFTDVLSLKANDFIQRAAADDVPFFIYIAPFAPHAPATPAYRHIDLFPSVTVPITPSFNEADVSDKPGNMSFNPLLSSGQILILNQRYRQRILSLQAVDEMMAELIKTLEQTGQLDNTYIIFTSDNGFHLGQHRLFEGKSHLYEEDITVPFIVRGPGIPEGRSVADTLAGNVDIASTISDWAGVVPPSFVDGTSFASTLISGSVNSTDQRQAYLLEVYSGTDPDDVEVLVNKPSDNILQSTFRFPSNGTQPLTPVYSGLRTNQYKYVEYADGFVELYDLLEDPYELENIAGSANKQLLENFSSQLKDMSTCGGSSCALIDSQPLSQ